MLIDTLFFQGNLSIAQVSQPAVVSALNMFIDEHEPKVLTELLGYALYKDLLVGLAGTPAAKWTDLRDGKEYTNRFGQLDKWRGLITTSGSSKKSLIANYVYYWWMRDQSSATTGSGEKVDKSAVSETVSGSTKMARAWNEMVQWNRELMEFLYSSSTVYLEFDTSRMYWFNGGWNYRNASVQNLRNLLTPINTVGI